MKVVLCWLLVACSVLCAQGALPVYTDATVRDVRPSVKIVGSLLGRINSIASGRSKRSRSSKRDEESYAAKLIEYAEKYVKAADVIARIRSEAKKLSKKRRTSSVRRRFSQLSSAFKKYNKLLKATETGIAKLVASRRVNVPFRSTTKSLLVRSYEGKYASAYRIAKHYMNKAKSRSRIVAALARKKYMKYAKVRDELGAKIAKLVVGELVSFAKEEDEGDDDEREEAARKKAAQARARALAARVKAKKDEEMRTAAEKSKASAAAAAKKKENDRKARVAAAAKEEEDRKALAAAAAAEKARKERAAAVATEQRARAAPLEEKADSTETTESGTGAVRGPFRSFRQRLGLTNVSG